MALRALLAPLPPAPASLAGADGRPLLGAFAGAPERLAPGSSWPPGPGALRRLLRGKRWLYLMAASEEAFVGAAVVAAGWFAGAFVWVADRRTGLVLAERSAAGLPRVSAEVGDRPGDGGGARFRGPGLLVGMARAGGAWRLAASARRLRVDVTLDARAAPPPLTLVAPVPDGGVRATVKAGALPARGTVEVAGRALALDGGSGGVDLTAGLLARETSWRWAFGTGVAADGAPVAFNLCQGNGLAPDDPGENALLVPGPARLPPVAFAFDADSPLSRWEVTSPGGAVALRFRPQAMHRERRELGLLRTRFAQVAGTFDGVVPGPGRPLEVRGLPGVVEDHFARW